MSQAWLEQRERGTPSALRLITWITQRIGYRAGRVLLHPICAYFIVFSRGARSASRDYLARMFGRPPTLRDVYRHYHTFAASLLDRVLFMTTSLDDFDVRVRGGEHVLQALAQGHGLVLLGSHLGSFEIVRVAAAAHPSLVVNVVMHEGNASKIAAWLREVAPDRAPRLIAPNRADTSLRIREALARGEIVAMLADRPIGRSATLSVPFLGANARFPTGPVRLALALDAPLVTFFGLYRGSRRYELEFEPLVPRDGLERGEAVTSLVRSYVSRLEAHARSAPFNWFNFYAYWNDA